MNDENSIGNKTPERQKPRWDKLAWLAWTIFTALYLFWPAHIDFYTDEGYFAEMTARVLRGELPNIDFSSNYLGLFYFYNALWFKLLGQTFFALRMGMLFLTSIVFVPIVYQLCRRLMPRTWGILTTLLVLSLTVCTNSSVTGNWYSLYAGLAAVWAFQRSTDFDWTQPKQRRFWLIVTGLALAIAFLMKHTVAVYTGLGLGMQCVLQGLYLQPYIDMGFDLDSGLGQPSQVGAFKLQRRLGQFAVIALLALAPMLAYYLVHMRLDGFRLLFYVLPPALISFWLGKRLYMSRSVFRYDFFLRQLIELVIGFLIPIALYLLPFVLAHGIAGGVELFRAVFVDYPTIYLKSAFLDYQQMLTPAAIVPIAWLLLMAWLARPAPRLIWILFGMGALAIAANPFREIVNASTAVILQSPLWFLSGGGVLFYSQLCAWDEQKKSETNLSNQLEIPSMAGGQVLLQRKDRIFALSLWILGAYYFLGTYPLGMMFYFSYTAAPFVLLLGYWLSRLASGATRPVCILVTGWVVYWIIFGGLMVYRQIGWYVGPNEPVFPNLPSLVYLGPDAGIYVARTGDYGERTLKYLDYIRRHSTRNDDIFMYGDGPEVYFLTRHINPSRYSYAIDSQLSDGADIVVGLEKHNTRFVFLDTAQNHFEHPLLDAYLNRHFKLKEPLTDKVLVFERQF